MRPDFGKVVTESPRRCGFPGPRVLKAAWRQTRRCAEREIDQDVDQADLDEELVTRATRQSGGTSRAETMHAGRRCVASKSPTDVLGPVKRLLHKVARDGLSWSATKRDLARALGGSYPGRHVLDTHIMGYVTENPHWRDGAPLDESFRPITSDPRNWPSYVVVDDRLVLAPVSPRVANRAQSLQWSWRTALESEVWRNFIRVLRGTTKKLVRFVRNAPAWLQGQSSKVRGSATSYDLWQLFSQDTINLTMAKLLRAAESLAAVEDAGDLVTAKYAVSSAYADLVSAAGTLADFLGRPVQVRKSPHQWVEVTAHASDLSTYHVTGYGVTHSVTARKGLSRQALHEILTPRVYYMELLVKAWTDGTAKVTETPCPSRVTERRISGLPTDTVRVPVRFSRSRP